jgi:hypothetical protein
MLQIPVSSTFSIAMHVGNASREIGLNIDGQEIKTRRVTVSDWVDSDAVFLRSGQHRITVSLPVLGQSFSDILIHNGLAVDQLLGPGSLNQSIQWVRLSETEYLVHIEADKPVFISLSESFDSHWNAYSNGVALYHFVSFAFANGFYLSSAGGDIMIRYEPDAGTTVGRGISIITMLLAILVSFGELLLNALDRNCKRFLRKVPVQR